MSDFPTIQQPEASLESLQTTAAQLKEAVEVLSGQRGNQALSTSRVEELARTIREILTQLNELQDFINRHIHMINRDIDRIKPSGLSAQFNELFNKVSTMTVDDLKDFQSDVAQYLIDFGAPQVVDGLPDVNGYAGPELVYDTITEKLYEYKGGQWVPVFDQAAVQAEIDDAIAAGIAASNITGQLTDTQLAAIDAAKITGQITGTQISDDAITTPKLAAGSVSTAALAAGAVTADEIAANAITSAKISAGAITSAKIAAGEIQASNIATGAITAGKVAANAITSGNIQTNAITAGKVAAGAIGADELTANAVIAGKIAAGAIDGIQITGSVIRTNATSTRVQLDSSSNEITVVRSGSVVARVNASTQTTWGVFTAFPSGDAYGMASVGSGVQIFGYSTGSQRGVYGRSTSNNGVYGQADGSGEGVYGTSASGIGTYGIGVVGVVGRATGSAAAVRADTTTPGAGTMQASAYNNFTGAHVDLVLQSDAAVAGDILVVTGVYLKASVNNAVVYVARSSTANQASVQGVLIERIPIPDAPLPGFFSMPVEGPYISTLKPEHEHLEDDYEAASYAALGEGCMNVCGEGGDIAVGDYIVTSNTPGKGMKKPNNTMDNTVVAKAREAVTFSDPTDVQFVAVVFLCG